MSLHLQTLNSDDGARVAQDIHDLTAGELHSIRLPQRGLDDRQKSISVRLLDSEVQKASANSLINRMYSWRGYGDNHQIDTSQNRATFTASSDDELIGTLTLTADSPSGLAVDKTFAHEIAELRKVPGVRLCELTKFAFDAAVPAKPVLAALFHIIFIYGSRRFNSTDLVIEVNPRHCRFYEAMLGFKRIGAVATNDGVGAPSQLMWLRVADIRRFIDENSGQAAENSRSLYPYFFSEIEERAIFSRIARVFDRGVGEEMPVRKFA